MTMIPVASAKLEQAAEQIHQLQKRIAELEAMLESIGAGGVGPMIAAPRQPLTDEQVMQAVRHLYQSDFAAGMGFPDDLDVARAIEAAHNIKD